MFVSVCVFVEFDFNVFFWWVLFNRAV